jgi:hypothetical protein
LLPGNPTIQRFGTTEVAKFAVEVDDNAAVSEMSKKFGNAKMQEIQAQG